MSLPKSIRVGYRDYAVEGWAPALATAAGRYGEADRMNLVIRVRDDLAPAVAAEVLLHEVIHCAYDNAALETGDSEERITLCLGNQLSQIWRDNPEFVAFMSVSLSGANPS